MLDDAQPISWTVTIRFIESPVVMQLLSGHLVLIACEGGLLPHMAPYPCAMVMQIRPSSPIPTKLVRLA